MEMMLDHGALSYQEKGSGRPFLLLNGFPFGAWEFTEVLEVLSWSSRAIALDLPGIGDSAPVPEPTPGALADILLFSFAKFGIDSFVLGACDIAGPVAYEIMRKQPGIIGGLLLFNTCVEPRGLKLPRFLESSKTTLVDLLRPSRRLENEIVCVMGQAERLDRDLMEKGLNNLKRSNRKVGADMFQRMRDAPFEDYHTVLRQFRKPVRILWGGRDPIFTRAQYTALRGLVPHARAETDDRIGHFFGIEEPNKLSHILQELGRDAWN